MSQKVGHRGTCTMYVHWSHPSRSKSHVMINARPEERKRKLHITGEKISYSKERNDQQDQNRIHSVESLRRRTSWCCCCSQPVSRMLATVLEWLTDFLTGAIMESRKAARSKAVASSPLPPPPPLLRSVQQEKSCPLLILQFRWCFASFHSVDHECAF